MLSANAVLPMFMLLAAGFLSQKAGVLTREDVPRFNKVAFRIFLPCLLFYNIYCSDLSAAVKPGLIIYAVCGVLLVFAAGLTLEALRRRFAAPLWARLVDRVCPPLEDALNRLWDTLFALGKKLLRDE